eukprot:359318-Prymnesium_polylepis.1
MYSAIAMGKKRAIEPHCASGSDERSSTSVSNQWPFSPWRPKADLSWPQPIESATPTVKPSKTHLGMSSM